MLTQITKDDTFVQSLIDEGRITEEEAHTHPQRSLLLRAITGQDVEPSLTMREARPGDRYLLCSDGLSGVVSDETLADTLSTYVDPRECADRLIELALRGGGPDNITCIVADVVDVDFGDDAPIVGGAAGDGRDDHPAARLRGRPRVGHHADPHRTAARAPGRPGACRPLPRAPAGAGHRRACWRCSPAAACSPACWVLQQYYVGAEQPAVAIFQGVRGSVLGPAAAARGRADRHRARRTCPRPRATRSRTASSSPRAAWPAPRPRSGCCAATCSRPAPCRVWCRRRRHWSPRRRRSCPPSRRAPHRSRPGRPPHRSEPGRRPERRHHPAPDGRARTGPQLSAGELR